MTENRVIGEAVAFLHLFGRAQPLHMRVMFRAAVSLCLLAVLTSFAFAQGQEVLHHALQRSPHETRLEIHTPIAPCSIRTSFLPSPRRLAVDLYFSEGSPAIRDGTLPLSGDPRIEKIGYSRYADHVRYTVDVKKGVPVQYRVEKGLSRTILVFQSAASEVGLTAHAAAQARSQGPSPPGVPGVPRPLTQEPKGSDEISSPTLEAASAAWGTPQGNDPVAAANPVGPPSPVCFPLAASSNGERKGVGEGFRFQGFLEATGGSDIKRDDHYEHTQSFRNRIRLEAKFPLASLSEKGRLVVSGESDFLWFGPHGDWNDHDIDFYEAYFQGTRGPWEFRVGKHILRWGKTDQLSPVDNVNPQDLRQFVVPTLEERKIPNWIAEVRFFHEPFSLEAVAVPFFEPDDVDFFGTDWAVFRHTPEVLTTAPLPPFIQDAAASVGVQRNEPVRTFRNTQWGVRTGLTLGRWDLAASYLYAWNPMPFIEHFPLHGLRTDGSFDTAEIIDSASRGTFVPGDVAVGYRRTHTFGLEWETVLGPYGFRGETALASHAVFLTSDLTSTTQRALLTVVGIDRTWAGNWYTNVQLGHQLLLDHDNAVLYFEKHNVSLNGEIRKDFLRGDLEVRLRGLMMLTDGGSMFNPSLTYRRFAPLSFTTGLNLFAGPSDTFLGTYSHNDEAYVTVRYDF